MSDDTTTTAPNIDQTPRDGTRDGPPLSVEIMRMKPRNADQSATTTPVEQPAADAPAAGFTGSGWVRAATFGGSTTGFGADTSGFGAETRGSSVAAATRVGAGLTGAGAAGAEACAEAVMPGRTRLAGSAESTGVVAADTLEVSTRRNLG